MSEKNITCQICLGDVDDPINFCVDITHENSCKECLLNYIHNSITTSHFGTCPILSCPSMTHKSNKKHDVTWSQRIHCSYSFVEAATHRSRWMQVMKPTRVVIPIIIWRSISQQQQQQPTTSYDEERKGMCPHSHYCVLFMCCPSIHACTYPFSSHTDS